MAPLALDEALGRIVTAATAVAPQLPETLPEPSPGSSESGARESVVLAEACGRVLAVTVHAVLDSPRADVSSMDGYAVRDDDATVGAALRVVATAAAGDGPCGAIAAGEAVRIFTGATIPAGATKVVIQENITREGDIARITAAPGADRFIRAYGSDFRAGDAIVMAGSLLSPGAIVAIAGAGAARVEVARRPRVMTLATGDELVAFGTAPGPGQIPNSIAPGLAAAIMAWGGHAVGSRVLGDDLARLEVAAREALAEADIVVVTGGASVGDRDHAKAMFEPAGLELIFSKVAIKPGKPVWLGRVGGTLVLGLPGNPVSAMVTARLFLRPLIAAMLGQSRPDPLAWQRWRLAAPLPLTGDRETLVRAVAGADGLVPLAQQDSGAQGALAEADWLIRCRAGQPALERGTDVVALSFW